MNNRQIGIILIIAGIALAIWGYTIYDSAGSRLGRVLSDDTPVEAWAAMVIGAVCAAFGFNKLK